MHREHVDRRAEHDSAQARKADAVRRLGQLETGLADVRAELDRTETDLRAARARMETAIDVLAALEPQRVELESERERMRGEQNAARAAAQSTRQHARELALQVESRRTSHASLETTLVRLDKQLEDLATAPRRIAASARCRRGAARGARGRARALASVPCPGRGRAARRTRRERGARCGAARPGKRESIDCRARGCGAHGAR